jgi:hypothetical protein
MPKPPIVGQNGFCPECGSDHVIKSGWTDDKERRRYRCRNCRTRFTEPEATRAASKSAPDFKTALPQSKLYVFTAAQNATPIHKPFWNALRNFCNHFGAELIVSGYRYKNPTSQWTENNRDHEWWSPETLPYLYQTREPVNEYLEFLGDVFPQATAVKPLTGFEALTGDRSCIIPHPKVQLRTVPTPAHMYPKIITTTGAVTVENYTKSKAGKLGEFHHTFGAVVVMVGDDGFQMMQISAQKNGSFFVLMPDGVFKVDAQGVTGGHKLAGLVLGDTHVDHVDPSVVAATFDDDKSIVSVGDPGWLVWHDLIDLYSRNRYANSPFIELAKRQDGTDSVYDELVRGWAFHDEMTRNKRSAVISSNHTNARLDWYMNNCDWREDLANAEFYLETALHMVRTLRKEGASHTYDDPFVWWGKKMSKAPNVTFPGVDDPFSVAGILCNYHGHIGPGAARSATLDNMRRIGSKVVFAHGHAPGTEEGAMMAGTSTKLRLGYNAGPSNWMSSHVGIFANGKRTHVFVMNGQWWYCY